jgi:uncharacterized protein (UPF0335 family)
MQHISQTLTTMPLSEIVEIVNESEFRKEASSVYIERINRLQDEGAELRKQISDLDGSLRGILAGWDVGSLPNDYSTARMAQDRMDQIRQLMDELHAIKYEVMGGEDAPGSANLATIEDVRNEMERLRLIERLGQG